MLDDIPIMAALKKRMRWLNSNQSVISQNISNADTPGYTAKRLEAQDFSNLVEKVAGAQKGNQASVGLKTNNARHMTADGNVVGSQAKVKETDEYEQTPDGNSVVLEEESLKLADNQMQYGLAVNLYRKNIGLMKSALGQGGDG